MKTPADQIAAAGKALAALKPNDPRRLEILKIRAEANARQAEDARRSVHEDVTDAELEARLVELNDDAGEVAIAHAEYQAAKNSFPDMPSTNTGQATQPDPRRLKAQRRWEEVRREAFALQAELDSRRALEHREQFVASRVQRELENVGSRDDQKLLEQHNKAIEAEFYADAAVIKKKLNTPYADRAWGPDVVHKAVKETEDILENSPGIRQVGQVITDFKKQQSVWEEGKEVRP